MFLILKTIIADCLPPSAFASIDTKNLQRFSWPAGLIRVLLPQFYLLLDLIQCWIKQVLSIAIMYFYFEDNCQTCKKKQISWSGSFRVKDVFQFKNKVFCSIKLCNQARKTNIQLILELQMMSSHHTTHCFFPFYMILKVLSNVNHNLMNIDSSNLSLKGFLLAPSHLLLLFTFNFCCHIQDFFCHS